MHEESYVFENRRRRKWSANGDAQTDMDEFLIHRNGMPFVRYRAQAENARLQRCRSLIENSDEDELTEIHQIGVSFIFLIRPGPRRCTGTLERLARRRRPRGTERPSTTPMTPAVLVRRLGCSEAGCRWLKSCWEELLGQLERRFWQSHRSPQSRSPFGGANLSQQLKRSKCSDHLRGQCWPESRFFGKTSSTTS